MGVEGDGNGVEGDENGVEEGVLAVF